MPDRWPRAMSARTAAEYCGIGTGLLTREGPAARTIGKRRKVWYKEDLDAWLDRIAGKQPELVDNPWPDL